LLQKVVPISAWWKYCRVIWFWTSWCITTYSSVSSLQCL